MADYGHDLSFGIFATPRADAAGQILRLARLADAAGLDSVSVQDHPYQPAFLDAWTLLTAIAAATERVAVFPNVANLLLRPPAVLARSVASLDILSGGRAELGIGTGAFWDAIAAMGGPRRTPGESVDALREAIGIDAAAAEAGRSPADVRRIYNISGSFSGAGSAFLQGPPKVWAEQLAGLALDEGMSGFVLATDDAETLERFAAEVAPAVRELVAAERAARTPSTRMRSGRRGPAYRRPPVAPVVRGAADPGAAGAVRARAIRLARSPAPP